MREEREKRHGKGGRSHALILCLNHLGTMAITSCERPMEVDEGSHATMSPPGWLEDIFPKIKGLLGENTDVWLQVDETDIKARVSYCATLKKVFGLLEPVDADDSLPIPKLYLRRRTFPPNSWCPSLLMQSVPSLYH